MNVVSTITSDISSRLAGLPVVLILANTFLVNARSHIDSLLTWIESFYQVRQKKLGCWFVLAFGVTLRTSTSFKNVSYLLGGSGT